jgi:hypothetical protein
VNNSHRLYNLRSKCNNPNSQSYKYYGGKGVKCLLSLADLEFLWERDRAVQLSQPSLDRIDSNGNYELSNCRFIEHSENSRRNHSKCHYCGGDIEPYKKKCAKCQCVQICKMCGKTFSKELGTKPIICNDCRMVTKQCSYCGKDITRDVAISKNQSFKKNKRWFCNMEEFNKVSLF